MIMIESGNQSIDLFKKERVNKELAIEKKLIINDDSKIYTSVQKLYIKCFEQILLSKVDLKKYEERIENSKCNIGPVKVKNKTYYHNLSSMNLKFIYIRNFFYVEKLNENDLSIMIQKVNNNNYEVDNALMDIVNRTYKDVLANNYVNGEYLDVTEVVYDASTGHGENYTTTSDALALTIQYGDNLIDLSGQAFMENMHNQIELLKSIQEELSSDITNNFGMKAKIFIRNKCGF